MEQSKNKSEHYMSYFDLILLSSLNLDFTQRIEAHEVVNLLCAKVYKDQKEIDWDLKFFKEPSRVI